MAGVIAMVLLACFVIAMSLPLKYFNLTRDITGVAARWIWKMKVGAYVKPTTLVCHVLVMLPLPEASIKCPGLSLFLYSDVFFVYIFVTSVFNTSHFQLL